MPASLPHPSDPTDPTDPSDSPEMSDPFESLIRLKTNLRRPSGFSRFLLFSRETELYVVYSVGNALTLSNFRRKVFSVMDLFEKTEISCRNQVFNFSESQYAVCQCGNWRSQE
jgi:hypothetical protein